VAEPGLPPGVREGRRRVRCTDASQVALGVMTPDVIVLSSRLA